MTVVVRDQRLARYAYDKLDLTVGAAMTKSRDWWARRLGAATLSKGGGGLWLLITGFWNDNGRWADNAIWVD